MSDMKLPPALARFLKTSERLKDLLGEYGAANKARALPEQSGRVYERYVSVRASSSYDNDESRMALDAAKAVMERCKAEAFADAETKRDERLHAIASELMQIRADLPSIVTQLVIELGVSSRQLTHEAEHGSS